MQARGVPGAPSLRRGSRRRCKAVYEAHLLMLRAHLQPPLDGWAALLHWGTALARGCSLRGRSGHRRQPEMPLGPHQARDGSAVRRQLWRHRVGPRAPPTKTQKRNVLNVTSCVRSVPGKRGESLGRKATGPHRTAEGQPGCTGGPIAPGSSSVPGARWRSRKPLRHEKHPLPRIDEGFDAGLAAIVASIGVVKF